MNICFIKEKFSSKIWLLQINNVSLPVEINQLDKMSETTRNEGLDSVIIKSEYKILIVDDVVSNVLLLKILLTNEKYQVCTASGGNMCIEMAKTEKPDLILLDVMMPDINGFDTATILKKDPETAEIPIIFLTALNNPSDLVHGFKVGASDFLTKPFIPDKAVQQGGTGGARLPPDQTGGCHPHH